MTNQRVLATPPPGLISRGHAVIETASADDPDAYVGALDATRYASMNLVYNAADGVRVAYTRREDATIDIVRLGPGIHVLCNDRIGAAGFPRGERLRAGLEMLAGQSIDQVTAALPRLLGDHTTSDATPVDARLPPALAHALTATCIHSEQYGTRSATILALAGDHVVRYLHADGPPCVTPFRDMHALL